MKVVLFGIYKIGVQTLGALLKRRIEIACVVTKPSTPEERQPVADEARQNQLPVLAPQSPRDPGFLEQIRELAPDLFVVGGYHKIFPNELLNIPPLGAINLHLSLLPRYRGPCPWKWAIANGEVLTGATVILLNPGVDDGDILAQLTTSIDDADTGESLFERLSVLGGHLAADTVDAIRAGTATRRAQDANLASYQSSPTDEDARIRWSQSSSSIRNLIRGFHSRPGAWTTYADVPLVIRKASLKEGITVNKPGTVIEVLPDSLLVSTGTGVLAIHEMILKGRTHAGGLLRDQLSIRCGARFEDGEKA